MKHQTCLLTSRTALLLLLLRAFPKGHLLLAVFHSLPEISFLVNCETQKEVDDLWEKLSEEGEVEQCGWLKDKFGVSWQIVPNILAGMVHDKDANKSERVIKAMLQMKKLDIQGLRKAYEQFDKRSWESY